MDLTVTETAVPPHHVIKVAGEIDVYTAPSLREFVVGVIESGNVRIVLDIEDVSFLDSTGLGVLVGVLKKVRSQDGSLDLICTNDRLLRIFAISGLDKVFGIHASVDTVSA